MKTRPIVDDYDAIRARVAELRAEAVPRCPLRKHILLIDCLRHPVACPADCPHAGDPVGPQQSLWVINPDTGLLTHRPV